MTAVADILDAVWGEGVHSLSAIGSDGIWRTVGFYCDSTELLDDAADQTRQGRNVYWSAHPLREGLSGGRGGADDVTQVKALSADIDWQSPAHKDNGKLKPEAEVRKALDHLADLTPSIVIETGHGVQCYWRLTTAVTAGEGAEMTLRMHAKLADLSPERADLASVLRVPGSINFKLDPIDVRVATVDLRGYSPDWIGKTATDPQRPHRTPLRPMVADD